MSNILNRELSYCNSCEQENNGYMLVEGKFEALRVEKVAIENELEVLKRRNRELEEQLRGIETKGSNEENEDEGEIVRLMIENSVLECEKKTAERDVEHWKSKCNKLEFIVAELEKKLVSKAGDGTSTKVLCGLQDTDALHQVKGLQEVCKITKSDEMQNTDGEIGSLQSQGSGKSLAKTPSVQAKLVGRNKALISESGNARVNQVRKRLTFEEERGSNKRMAPSTPAGVRPAKVVVIDIAESDDERTIVPLCTPPIARIVSTVPYCGSGNTLSNIELPSENNSKMIDIEQGEDDDMVCHNEEALYVPTPKRRRASNIIASDTDTDNDDKVPICMLETRHLREKGSDDHPRGRSIQTGDSEDEVRKLSRRRHLVKLCQFEGEGGSGNDIEEEVSDSEGESLGGFIVNSSDISDDDDISNSDSALQSNSSVAENSITDSEYISESDSDYGEIMSRIRRNKSDKLEWEFEGDMLAAFGKDPELCMKAVCVLYRQQTEEEKCSKETIFHNQRGFSQCDAFRYDYENVNADGAKELMAHLVKLQSSIDEVNKGSTLAEFLTDGDRQGDMMKSVKELQAYDPRGIEVCIALATRYSKQLFSIYKNKEDPFFSAP